MTRDSGLLRQLLRIGRRSSWQAESGRVRFWSLTLATALLSLAVGGLVLADASFDGRAQRGEARSPRMVAGHPQEPARALIKMDIAADGIMPYDVIYLEPLTADAPLPPGLPRWPRPGEAFVSPAVLESGEAGVVRSQYGEFAGVIGAEGLEAPSEVLVYARPRAEFLDKSRMSEISGFGEFGSGGAFGEHVYHSGSRSFLAVYAGMVLFPAGTFVILAARLGAAARDRRTVLLSGLGAGRLARGCFTLGEAAVPVALGVLIGASGVAGTLAADTALPLVDFILSAQDARAAIPVLAGGLAAAAFAVLALVVLLQPGTRGPRVLEARVRRGWTQSVSLWVFPLALLFCVWVVDLVPTVWIVPCYALGAVVTLATLPGVIGAVVGRLGPVLARIGWRTGQPGALLAGRRMGAAPRAVTRLVAAMVIAIGLAAQAQVWAGYITDSGAQEVAAQQRVGSTVLRVAATATAARMNGFEAALPAGVHALELRRPSSDGSLELTGSCAGLGELGLSCTAEGAALPARTGDQRLHEVLRMVGVAPGGQDRVIARRTPSEQPAKKRERRLIVVREGGGDLSVPAIRQIARHELGMTPSVRLLNEVAGTGPLVTATTWLRLLSMVGVAVVAVAATAAAMGEFLRFGRELAPVAVLTANRRVFRTAALWSLLFPAVLAALGGVLVSWWLAAPILSIAVTSPGALAPITVGALLCAGIMTIWGGYTAIRIAERWRPGAE
ncbi:hypothetical protein ACFQLX_04100 [Streptomyces polyrhachis]|uniref:FtsX-like permease family protein n=1 Tax=Streptomyces polyrhachis TaxID=1282885 RepID=A0ABW2G999_9ACTN